MKRMFPKQQVKEKKEPTVFSEEAESATKENLESLTAKQVLIGSGGRIIKEATSPITSFFGRVAKNTVGKIFTSKKKRDKEVQQIQNQIETGRLRSYVAAKGMSVFGRGSSLLFNFVCIAVATFAIICLLEYATSVVIFFLCFLLLLLGYLLALSLYGVMIAFCAMICLVFYKLIMLGKDIAIIAYQSSVNDIRIVELLLKKEITEIKQDGGNDFSEKAIEVIGNVGVAAVKMIGENPNMSREQAVLANDVLRKTNISIEGITQLVKDKQAQAVKVNLRRERNTHLAAKGSSSHGFWIYALMFFLTGSVLFSLVYCIGTNPNFFNPKKNIVSGILELAHEPLNTYEERSEGKGLLNWIAAFFNGNDNSKVEEQEKEEKEIVEPTEENNITSQVEKEKKTTKDSEAQKGSLFGVFSGIFSSAKEAVKSDPYNGNVKIENTPNIRNAKKKGSEAVEKKEIANIATGYSNQKASFTGKYLKYESMQSQVNTKGLNPEFVKKVQKVLNGKDLFKSIGKAYKGHGTIDYITIEITSCTRDVKYNKTIGSKNSNHVFGNATDGKFYYVLKYSTKKKPFTKEMIQEVKKAIVAKDIRFYQGTKYAENRVHIATNPSPKKNTTGKVKGLVDFLVYNKDVFNNTKLEISIKKASKHSEAKRKLYNSLPTYRVDGGSDEDMYFVIELQKMQVDQRFAFVKEMRRLANLNGGAVQFSCENNNCQTCTLNQLNKSLKYKIGQAHIIYPKQ